VREDELILRGDEAKHLTHVLRAKVGDVFFAIDGTGRKFRSVIQAIDGKSVTAMISSITRLENEPFAQVTLAQGICRPNKMDDIIEKGTEVGVVSFCFYYSEKAYSRMVEEPGTARKIIRLERVARAAAKQCKRSLIPSVEPLMPYADILHLRNEYEMALVAAMHPSSRPLGNQIGGTANLKKILLLVGPESGLTDDEIMAAVNAGFLPITFGPRRLRTETAGVIFPALVLSYLGDL
jgi:16S rRNA (uracil1498-N3)-methyltransferase